MTLASASDYSRLSVVITTMTGAQLEVSKLITQINIYQDMFSPCITGNMNLMDAGGVFDIMPIAGYETIQIVLETVDNGTPVIFDKTYRIFSVEDYRVEKQNLKTYTIKFASESMYANRVNVHYNMRKLKTHEAIQPMLENHLGITPDQIEYADMSGELQRPMIFGFLNPFTIIRKIVNKSMSKGTNATFLFYERKDKFVLNSLDNIAQTTVEPKRTFNYVPSATDISTRYSKDRIFSFRIESAFNRLKHETNGARAIESVVHDMVRKRQDSYLYDYSKQFNDIKHLEGNTFISNKEKEVNSCRVVSSANSSSQDMLSGSAVSPHQVASRRMNQMQNLNTIKVIADVPGDLVNELGDVVAFNLVNSVSSSAVIEKHKYLSGLYFITAIHHVIDPKQYLQVLELTKDSLPDTLHITDDVDTSSENFVTTNQNIG